MKYVFNHKDGEGKLIFQQSAVDLNRYYQPSGKDDKMYTIVWNRGEDQTVVIDEIMYLFQADCLLPIMMSQSFRFERPEQIVSWQFNREFYCVLNHDAEVGCVGFVFYGPSPTMFVQLEPEDMEGMEKLVGMFLEEFDEDEDIKGDMLRMLLVRLIIKLTRLAKKQYLSPIQIANDKFDLFRQFNVLVELHFRKHHQVQFYAGLLNKSPKTIANLFHLYSTKTPLEVIHERIISEAKRLFYYTDKSVKEIADHLGFEDTAHFSKLFKKHTAQSPSQVKRKG